jgi:hypothetical protein
MRRPTILQVFVHTKLLHRTAAQSVHLALDSGGVFGQSSTTQRRRHTRLSAPCHRLSSFEVRFISNLKGTRSVFIGRFRKKFKSSDCFGQKK